MIAVDRRMKGSLAHVSVLVGCTWLITADYLGLVMEVCVKSGQQHLRTEVGRCGEDPPGFGVYVCTDKEGGLYSS